MLRIFLYFLYGMYQSQKVWHNLWISPVFIIPLNMVLSFRHHILTNNEDFLAASRRDEIESIRFLTKLTILHEKVTSAIPEINRCFTFQVTSWLIPILIWRLIIFQMIFISSIYLYKSVLGFYCIFQDLVLKNTLLAGYGIPYIYRESVSLGMFIHPINAATSLANEVIFHLSRWINISMFTSEFLIQILNFRSKTSQFSLEEP